MPSRAWASPISFSGSGKLGTLAATLKKLEIDTPLRYGITDRLAFPDLSPAHYLRLVFRTRAAVVQLREKDLDASRLRDLVRLGLGLARESRRLLLINNAVQIALEEGADGVHLTSAQEVAPALELRRRLSSDDFLIGKSVHSVSEAVRAESEGVDYVLLGPVFDPISKESIHKPLGWAALREACQMLYIPVIALGGIDSATEANILSTNALGLAGISWMKEEIEALEEGAG